VERIVSHRDTGSTTEYLCKWNGLNYDHCTWEAQDEIKPIAKEQIAAYRQREAEGRFPFKSNFMTKAQRPVFRKIKEDPEYISATGGELKDFQLTGLNWLAYLWHKGQNGILADEMGLGKVSLQLFRSTKNAKRNRPMADCTNRFLPVLPLP
jgi:chromodomain-helicase-DNA-binding protein 1